MRTETKFRHLGTMIDCSRNAVMSVEAVKKWIDVTADMGYNTLMLYTEDTYEVNNQPYFGYMRGRYSKEELKEMDSYALSRGMELIPCIQTLAHLNAIYRWPMYNEIRDIAQILIVGDERTYKLIDDMFASLEESLSTHTVNVGMDETYFLGRGKYLDANGYEDGIDILVKHVTRVAEIAKKHNFELLMWGDMFFHLLSDGKHTLEEIKAKIPDNVNIIYWDYYSTDNEKYLNTLRDYGKLTEEPWYAGGIWTWIGFTPHNDYSMKTIDAAIPACIENGTQDVIYTLWGDNGAECPRFSTLPSLLYVAEKAKGNNDLADIKKKFYEKFNIDFDTFMLLDLPETPNDVEGNTCDADKYMLFNDCFSGLFDTTIADGSAEAFAKCADKLEKVEKDNPYGYMFECAQKLCTLLGSKAELGKKIRAAYNKKDTNALKVLICEIENVITLTDEFYYSLRKQWMVENKPHGFDVQDLRIGGMVYRLRHCKERLEAYLNGEIESIPELEETLLDPLGKGTNYSQEPINFNTWGRIVTANLNYGD